MGPKNNALGDLPGNMLDSSLIGATPTGKPPIGDSLNISQNFVHPLAQGTPDEGFFDNREDGGQNHKFGSLLPNHVTRQDRQGETVKENQATVKLQPQIHSNSSVTTPLRSKSGSQTIVVMVQVDQGEKARIPNVPVQLKPDDEDEDEILVLPILKFIEKRGQ